MYNALAKHGGMELTMKCQGDLWIDDHHTADTSATYDAQTFGGPILDLHRIAL